MKKILVVMLATIAFYGCSSDDEEPLVLELVSWEGESPFDKTTRIALGSSIFLYKDGTEINRRKLYAPEKEIIDVGYGEIIELEYNTQLCIFLKNNFIVMWGARHNQTYKQNHVLYTDKLDSITTIKTTGRISNYGENAFILNEKETNKITQYSSLGKIVYEKEYSNQIKEFPSLYKNIPLSNEEFINIGENNISKCSFEEGVIWSNNFTAYITNKPEGEQNPPKIVLDNYEFQSNLIIVTFDVTYYNGKNEIVKVKIDTDTGEKS